MILESVAEAYYEIMHFGVSRRELIMKCVFWSQFMARPNSLAIHHFISTTVPYSVLAIKSLLPLPSKLAIAPPAMRPRILPTC
jgi:hypothetical protein